jgi:hypothetical protein
MKINVTKNKYNGLDPMDKKAFAYLSKFEDNEPLYLDVKKHTRTTAQNSALHLYFTHVSEALNELGIEHNYTGISGKTLSLKYTQNLVKELIWRPIQITMFNLESTTEIGTNEINEIYDVINKFLSEKGVYVPFPDQFTKYYNQKIKEL